MPPPQTSTPETHIPPHFHTHNEIWDSRFSYSRLGYDLSDADMKNKSQAGLM